MTDADRARNVTAALTSAGCYCEGEARVCGACATIRDFARAVREDEREKCKLPPGAFVVVPDEATVERVAAKLTEIDDAESVSDMLSFEDIARAVLAALGGMA